MMTGDKRNKFTKKTCEARSSGVRDTMKSQL